MEIKLHLFLMVNCFMIRLLHLQARTPKYLCQTSRGRHVCTQEGPLRYPATVVRSSASLALLSHTCTYDTERVSRVTRSHHGYATQPVRAGWQLCKHNVPRTRQQPTGALLATPRRPYQNSRFSRRGFCSQQTN